MDLAEDLAVAYRTLADHGVIDAYGHVSVRSDRAPARYLLARAVAPELVTPADVIEYDLDSTPLDAHGRESVRERFIHGEIYRERPEINAVVHTHSVTVIPFGVCGVALRPLFHLAAFIGAGVPNFEIRAFEEGTDLLVKTPYLGRALAKTLGRSPAALMRGHGAVAVGESLPRAVGRAIYLELSAKMQLAATVLAGPGGKFIVLDEKEVQAATALQDYGRAWDIWRRKALQRMTDPVESKETRT
jgi:ribulose-5-phosphate 4-epimerase/fuculose-1-phosphate aldolase